MLNMNFLKQYGTNTFWLLAERGIQMGLAFVVGIFIARSLGPGPFGLFNYAVSFNLFWAFWVMLGLDQVVIYELLRHPEDKNLILGSAFLLRLIGLGGMIAAVTLSGVFIPLEPITRIIIFVILTGYIGYAVGVIDFCFQAHVCVKHISRAVIACCIIFALINLWGCYHRCGLLFFAVTNSMLPLLISLLKLWMYRKYFGSVLLWRFSVAKMCFLMQKSGWILLQTLLGCIAANVGILILKELCDNRILGFYAIVVKILACAIIFPDVLCQSLFPFIIKHRDDRPAYRLYLARLYRILFWGAALAIPAAFLLGEPVIAWLYGADYRLPGSLLWIAMLSFPLQSLSYGFAKWCVIEQNQHSLCVFALGSLTGILLGTWLFAQTWGFPGALAALLCSSLTGWLFCLCCGKGVRDHILFLGKSLWVLGFNPGSRR